MWRGVLVLATAIVVAGCSANPKISLLPGNPKVNPIPREYVVCTTPAIGCIIDAAMKAKPAEMTLSGDGSLYVKDISWDGWGTATATGRGTAEADNCDPNCAQGTYRPHPAMLVLASPEPWHGDLAYGRITENVAQIGWHQTFTQRLMPGAWAPPPRTGVTPPPSPGRVSMQPATGMAGTWPLLCRRWHARQGSLTGAGIVRAGRRPPPW